MSHVGTKGVPRADREEQILAIAGEVFGSEGFAATSVAEIARRAGISKPLVYQYFGSKEGLFTACLHQAGAILAEEIERIARGDSVGLERALLTLDGIFTTLGGRPWTWRLFFDPTLPSNEAVAREIAHYTDRITRLAEEGVGELMALVGNTDPGDLSAMVRVWMSIVDALVGWWLDHPSETAAQMSERCVRLFHAAFSAQVPALSALLG